MELKEGDVVQLISGGPLMTVEFPEYDGDAFARCAWFDNNGEVHVNTFKHSMLVKKEAKKEKSGGMHWG